MTLATAVRMLRFEQKKTAQEVADAAGLARGMVMNIETGRYTRVSDEEVAALASAFGISAEALLELSGPVPDPAIQSADILQLVAFLRDWGLDQQQAEYVADFARHIRDTGPDRVPTRDGQFRLMTEEERKLD